MKLSRAEGEDEMKSRMKWRQLGDGDETRHEPGRGSKLKSEYPQSGRLSESEGWSDRCS